MPLTKSQLKFLKQRCHDLKPVIMIGQKGLSENVLQEIEIALEHHELVKMKIAMDDRDARREMIESICSTSNAELVQTIGKTASIYRKHPRKPVISLPTK